MLHDAYTERPISKRTGKPASRQWVHQMRKRSLGFCMICTEMAGESGLCDRHLKIKEDRQKKRHRETYVPKGRRKKLGGLTADEPDYFSPALLKPPPCPAKGYFG